MTSGAGKSTFLLSAQADTYGRFKRMETQVKPASPREIAYAIESDWKNVSPYAQPYLQAMKQLESVSDSYFADNGSSVILYFLANAGSYRGEGARAYKALLKAMVK